MNFKDILFQLAEESRAQADSFRTTGEAMKKERATASSTDRKSKDAARKRAERSRQVPRTQKSKEELVKEVLAVQTPSGRVQLIFKDSFDKNRHTVLNKGQTMTMEEARAYVKNENFEQTGASKLLFGDVKTSEKKEQGNVKGKEEAKEKTEQGEKEPITSEEKPKKQVKKMSKEEIFTTLSQMAPEQLAQVPFEIRQEYFMQNRNPPSNNSFDSLTFEKLSTLFGINTLTSTSYNQQVINALVFLAKIKAGASEQEIQSYAALSPNAFDFTKVAFLQARKILSQIGEQCIQTLVSTVENGTNGTYSEGNVDMECGDYKFKISAGGEFLLTTDKFDQKSKSYRGIIGAALNQAISNAAVSKDPKMKSFVEGLNGVSGKFSENLLSLAAFEQIKKNPVLMDQLKKTPLVDGAGRTVGNMIDSNGSLNKLASLENFTTELGKQSIGLMKNAVNKSSEFADSFLQTILKTVFRGDGIKDPKMAPNHVITQNGVFPLTDDYFSEIAKTATISVKPIKNEPSSDNISKRIKPSERLNQFSRMVEQAEIPESDQISLNNLFTSQSSMNPLAVALGYASQNMDFDINVSLLPGFSPKDLNTIQYNYVTIGKKTIKIPVEKTELISLELQERINLFVNDILVEALTNNFVLDKLVKSELLTGMEAELLTNPNILNEDSDHMKFIYRDLLERANENPRLLLYVLNAYNSHLYEKYQRDYKMEYRNYHGKAKQRKERAKRTSARERLMKKGVVKKGDGKDIDHRKPLRNGGSNGINNLRIRKKSENRADNGHKKGEKQNKDWK
jgi:hypothetical protein